MKAFCEKHFAESDRHLMLQVNWLEILKRKKGLTKF